MVLATAVEATAVAAKSATYNIILQVFVRIISFVSNAVLLRFIGKNVLGVINVRLMLLYSTTHCLSREAFRRSCLCKFEQYDKKLLNLLWFPVPLSIITGSLLRLIWLYVLEVPDTSEVPYYHHGVNATVISVFIEMLAEPIYILSQNFNYFRLKVAVEGISHTFKSLCMVVLMYKWPHLGVYVFCCSQVFSSILYSVVYYCYFAYRLKSANTKDEGVPLKSIFDIFPKWSSSEFIDRKMLSLTWSFYKQTILKQILTEGERYIMTFFKILSFSEQGVYDVISNLGSMAARFIFLPIEDSSYMLFSNLLKRGCQADKQKNPEACGKVLQLISKLMLLIGLTILVFGQSYSQLLLFIYGGQHFINKLAVSLLKWHCIYIFFIAVNGVTECFVFATMSSEKIDRYNQKMIVFSAIFLIMSYCFVSLYGSIGFLLANCINMICRITHSLKYIQDFFNKKTSWLLQTFLPHQCVLFVSGVCLVLTSVSEAFLFESELWIMHFFFGVCCLLVLLLIIFYFEKNLVNFIIYLLFKKGQFIEEKDLLGIEKKRS